MNLSVIICAHNPRTDYLRRTLDSLKAQTLPKEQWELLLVDNVSTEPLANRWDLSWHPHARIISESRLGLTSARLAGIQATDSEWILFIDDDNVVESNYLTKLMALATAFPQLGCIGAGVLAPEYEEEPAPELRPHCPRLALRTVTSPQWSNIPEDGATPWGAGLAARRDVAKKYAETVSACSIRLNLDRKGSQLISCGDNEFSWVACEMGCSKGIFPELKITHLIDRKRVQQAYLERMEEGLAFSMALINHLHGGQRALSNAEIGLKIAKATIKSAFQRIIAGFRRDKAGRKIVAVNCRMKAAHLRGLKKAGQFIKSHAGKQARDAE